MGNKTKIIGFLHEQYDSLVHYATTLRDIRTVGTGVFVVLVLLVSWSGAKAIQTNYRLQQDATRMSQENEVMRLKNANQELQNEYYTTSQYREITARQNFGLAAPGETVLLVSKETALAHTVPMPGKAGQAPLAKNKPFWQENFETWMDFFLHRQR